MKTKLYKTVVDIIERMPNWMFITSYVMISIMLIILFWFPARWLHYKFAYEVKVEKQIVEMVKPEALKEKYRK